jgi:dipeptidyl aminopeptidase/acylaminoacyl peptidase
VVELQVSGRGGVPVGFLGTVALNVTATGPSAWSFLTVFPTGELRPDTSSLNFAPGSTVANLVLVPTSLDGRVTVANAYGATDVVVDVLGYVPVTIARALGDAQDVYTSSADGSTIAFSTASPTGATLSTLDVTSGAVSTIVTGPTSPGIYGVSVSADGSTLAFMSDYDQLVPADWNRVSDIFVHHRGSATLTRINTNHDGAPPPGDPQILLSNFVDDPQISADGRYVAYTQRPIDDSEPPQILVHDLVTGTTERVDVSSAEVPANAGGRSPRISADGRFVAFRSVADNLVAADTNDDADVFVRDRVAGTTVRVSLDSNGNQLDIAPEVGGGERDLALAADASVIVFTWGDQVLRRDLTAGVTSVVAERPAGGFLNGIDADGAAGRVAISSCRAFWDCRIEIVDAGGPERFEVLPAGRATPMRIDRPVLADDGSTLLLLMRTDDGATSMGRTALPAP